MTTRINVTRPFVFSMPAKDGRLPRQISFGIGEWDLDDDVASHPWMKEGLADGAIESPQAGMLRAKTAKDKADTEKTAADNAMKQAQAALDRISASQPASAKASELNEKDLNTPANELRAKQDGAGETPFKKGDPVKPDPKSPTMSAGGAVVPPGGDNVGTGGQVGTTGASTNPLGEAIQQANATRNPGPASATSKASKP